jgi:hypothetical protein
MVGLRKSCLFSAHVILLTIVDRIFLNVMYCHYLNRRKADGKEEKWRGCGDDRDPEFRFVL